MTTITFDTAQSRLISAKSPSASSSLTLRFPKRLPYPTVEGYSIRPDEAIIRTDMEAGPARQRRRYTQTPTKGELLDMISNLEKEIKMPRYYKFINGFMLNFYDFDISEEEALAQGYKTANEPPQDGDVVLMRQAKNPVHAGIWLDVDGGGVLHCVREIGVVFQDIASLNLCGWFLHSYYRVKENT